MPVAALPLTLVLALHGADILAIAGVLLVWVAATAWRRRLARRRGRRHR